MAEGRGAHKPALAQRQAAAPSRPPAVKVGGGPVPAARSVHQRLGNRGTQALAAQVVARSGVASIRDAGMEQRAIGPPGEAHKREAAGVPGHVPPRADPASGRANGVPASGLSPGPLVQRRGAGCGNEGKGMRVQTSLTISQPGDAFEQEADRVADTVMNMATPSPPRAPGISAAGGQGLAQRKEGPDSAPRVTPDVETNVRALQGEGSPLPPATRAHFEQRFGADFSEVRVNTGGRAQETAQTLGARAFTVGRSITFGAGQYAPESQAGQRLLAHELTHVVQQDAGIRRSGAPVQRQQATGDASPDKGNRAHLGMAKTVDAAQLQAAWYNFSIPFTDYQFDPSLEGLKTAGNLAADKARAGATWMKDKVVGAVKWIVARLTSLINSGIEWLTGEFNKIQNFAVSSFADIQGAVSGALGAITSPLGIIKSAFGVMDAGMLSGAWHALKAGASAAWKGVKAVVGGVLKFGGGIWNAVSKFVDTLFSAADSLLDSTAFDLLPDVVQAPIKGLYKQVRGLWTAMRDFWTDLWKRLTAFVDDVLASIEAFVQMVESYAIDKVVETVRKLKEVYDFVVRFVTDPEAVIKPILASIAGTVRAEAPGKAREVAQQKMAEAWASSQPAKSSGPVVHKAPDNAAPRRSTATRAEVNENVNRELAAHWAALDLSKMLWDTVVNLFYPPATIKAIGAEFDELWNTDWKNAVDSLFTPRSIVDDFSGFWHDVWSNFRILLDFPLALWRRLNNILMLLMGYVTILLILAGLVLGGLAGGVPGAMAAAAAGAALAWAIGEALFVSFLLAESLSALKAFADLYTARQTEPEKQRDYVQIAASVIGLGVAIVVAILFMILGAFVRAIVGRIKGGAPKLPAAPGPPKQLGPGPEPPKQLGPGPEPPKQLGPGPEPPKQLGPGPEPPKQLGPGPEPPKQLGPGPEPGGKEPPKTEPPGKEPPQKKPGKERPKDEPAPGRKLQDLTIEELVKEGEKKPRPKETKEQAAERVKEAKAEAQRRGYCFVKGTSVQTSDGPKNVETLAAGQLVLGMGDGEDTVRNYAVAGIMRGIASTLYRVEAGAGLVLSATGSHPFFIVGRGWTRARDIARGDRLRGLSGDSVVVTNVSRVRLAEPVTTFNLHVEEAHNYFVGEGQAVLVHNGTPIGDPVLNGPLIWGLGAGGPRQRLPRAADPENPDPKLRDPIKGDVDGASGWRTNSLDEAGRMLGTRVPESTGNHGAITEAQLRSQGLVAVNTPGEGALAGEGFTHVSIRPASNPDPHVELTDAEMAEVKAKLEGLKTVAQNKAADFLCV